MLIVKENITHQDIGGKEFVMEFEIKHEDILFEGTFGGNWACRNFMNRRSDFNVDFPYKTYYGKVGNLGYVVSEDELIQKEE